LCGTTLNRLELERCEACGVVVGTARYRDFIAQRVSKAGLPVAGRTLCASCARQQRAACQSENLPPG